MAAQNFWWSSQNYQSIWLILIIGRNTSSSCWWVRSGWLCVKFSDRVWIADRCRDSQLYRSHCFLCRMHWWSRTLGPRTYANQTYSSCRCARRCPHSDLKKQCTFCWTSCNLLQKSICETKRGETALTCCFNSDRNVILGKCVRVDSEHQSCSWFARGKHDRWGDETFFIQKSSQMMCRVWLVEKWQTMDFEVCMSCWKYFWSTHQTKRLGQFAALLYLHSAASATKH